MAARYIDVPATMQVIGGIYLNPALLDDERYKFNQDDFVEKIHQVIFGSIYNLYKLGAKKIDPNTIENYLEQRPKLLAIYKTNKGNEYLANLATTTQPETFDYYYNRVKKMTLLRMYNEQAGMDLSWLYDLNNLFDAKKKQQQEDHLDNTSITDLADEIDRKVDLIKAKYAQNADDIFEKAGDRDLDLLQSFMEHPDWGYPLYTQLLNTVWQGQRLGKFYLRSAPTNVGKSRAMIADACFTGCEEIYDTATNQWIKNGTAEPTVYITTEQIYKEIASMNWAFLSGVPEDHITLNQYEPGEIDRVKHAIEVLKNSKLYIKELHDYNMEDLENTIKFCVREYDAKYIYLDYIHSNMKILSEIGGGSKVTGLREDNVLFLIGVKLKDLAVKYNVYIMSSTQLNGNYVNSDAPDQNLLRGAKSLGDKVDGGCIMLLLTDQDKQAIQQLCSSQGFEIPNLKISIYKNRGGRFNHCYIWCKADLGVCRIKSLFATEYDYTLIDMPTYNINIKEESAF